MKQLIKRYRWEAQRGQISQETKQLLVFAIVTRRVFPLIDMPLYIPNIPTHGNCNG